MQRTIGEMARRFRTFDWSRTSIGPPERWPLSWRKAVEFILDSSFPCALALGPELLYFYNDAFIPLGGPTRHPGALGQPVPMVWKEIWVSELASRFQETLSTGLPTGAVDLMMPLMRNGYLEETYMTFSFVVLRDDESVPNGICCTAIENTALVVQRRQVDCLRRLAANCAAAGSPEEVCRLAATVLEEQARDVPFALLYLSDPAREGFELAASAGLSAMPAVPGTAPLGGSPWQLDNVRRSEAVLIEDVAAVEPVLRRPGLVPQRALLLPVFGAGAERPSCVLLVGLNPMRPVAESRAFHELIAAHLEKAIDSARMRQHAERRARELAELDRAKTRFFSNASHELRTPLTLLLEPLRMVLAGDRLVRADQELLATAAQAGVRLRKLVNALLDFSRIETGPAHAHYVPTDLALATADLAGMFRALFEHAGVALIIDCPTLPEPAYVDPEMWTKIVLNLLSNALKFTLEGQVSVRLRAGSERFELDVTDTGCGIAEEDLPRIFQRFAVSRPSRARTAEGTGIGLSYVQELVRLHGGTVEARSQPGAGTTVTVLIPRGSCHLPQDRIGTAPEPAALRGAQPFLDDALGWLDEDHSSSSGSSPESAVEGEPPEPGRPAEDEAGRQRILVVDDNVQMRRFLSRLLQERWHVETAPDGAAALEQVHRRPPDVVICDIMMPRLDGIEMLRALRADPTTAHIPVLLLSARAGEEASVGGLQAGADDYLVKPFSTRELLARIETQLARAKQRAAERHAREHAEQTLRARQEFFAALAHEIRSPVSSLSNWIGVLRDETLGNERSPSRLHGGLDAMEFAAQSLRRLCSDLYDVARAGSGKLSLRRERFESLAPLVAGAIDALRPELESRKLILHSTLDHDSGPVSVDPDRLQQICRNLLSNAIRFTPAGGRIEVRCHRHEDMIELLVRDTGRGIPAEALPYVFERYWQGVPGSGHGLGLGLTICRALVELHGGHIEARSEGEGCGATFIVRLPLADD